MYIHIWICLIFTYIKDSLLSFVHLQMTNLSLLSHNSQELLHYDIIDFNPTIVQ
uniref:Macaca fascicularis brain cDNA clone: QmoA-10901, similar to human leprecan-like 1 (LEPREL1), mRNA, RefSeq: NM_018192.2 n=1 Tax=Macaca fascicularis TaxID=9541 RepID=I7GN29_MACFA|nr:unnamed protein product [Macaca fascicularis]